ncbi:MAPEG family protein [Gilvimarinus agarilyticus]|uniref:MAPEG family protein n=1 Tax=unclassified Gilvimarinus TaxID=2642066 RepID=UPI001C09256F|nr:MULTISPECIES: MAPEG family protein [unclassified Gilvimarinus]MBU2887837.1 MAPEG family protein [Gilvimarinus agarilyticus]MDO6572475.1 MAPEG family protein [Gilvimarinus sp. 2_MG-2023]MDO6746615.1 MAPEG family protein [Gilvimarinus sp. 1_MG-2023]
MNYDYSITFIGTYIALVTLFIQAVVAAGSKAKQPGAVPGKISDELSHDSFVFRAHRTFMNSLENMPLFIGSVFLGVFAGAHPRWLGILVVTYALARFIHMALYYAIATEKNPSPRSYFYGIALLAQIGMLVLIGAALV